MLAFLATLTLGGPYTCGNGHTSTARDAGRAVGITLDKTNDNRLNGSYSNGERTLRFETVRYPREQRAGEPLPDRDYDIALRLMDAAGKTLLILSEGDNVPSQWIQEVQNVSKSGQPIEPEMFQLALETAQAVEQLKLPRDLQPEQTFLAKQLAFFGSKAKLLPPRPPPDAESR